MTNGDNKINDNVLEVSHSTCDLLELSLTIKNKKITTKLEFKYLNFFN